MHIVKCFASAKREIMCYRTLWNISPCSMWNEICPRPRKRTFHICGANISPQSDFTCPKGQISLRTCSMAGTRRGSAIEQYQMEQHLPTGKRRRILRFFAFFSWQALLLWAQKHIVKCFAFAKREIMCYRTLWNISPCSMWNKICPRPRKRTFHICGANISPRSDFICP